MNKFARRNICINRKDKQAMKMSYKHLQIDIYEDTHVDLIPNQTKIQL